MGSGIESQSLQNTKSADSADIRGSHCITYAPEATVCICLGDQLFQLALNGSPDYTNYSKELWHRIARQQGVVHSCILAHAPVTVLCAQCKRALNIPSKPWWPVCTP